MIIEKAWAELDTEVEVGDDVVEVHIHVTATTEPLSIIDWDITMDDDRYSDTVEAYIKSTYDEYDFDDWTYYTEEKDDFDRAKRRI